MATLLIHGRSVEIPDLSRVVYPGEDVLKGDVLHYYFRVAPVVMPHMRGRTLTLGRARDDSERVDSPGTADDAVPGWVRVAASEEDGSPTSVVADEPAVLAVLVQRSCFTPHASLSRVGTPRRPDRLVFDLNPPALCDEAYLEVCQAAHALGALILELGLVPFAMTSGSRGVHVHVPIHPQRFEVVSSFARAVARQLVLANRCRLGHAGRDGASGKVTIDALPSAHRRTFVVPYGLRALPGAPVATPQSWGELGAAGTGPRDHTISSVFTRLARAGDPWRHIDGFARCLPRRATGVGVTA